MGLFDFHYYILKDGDDIEFGELYETGKKKLCSAKYDPTKNSCYIKNDVQIFINMSGRLTIRIPSQDRTIYQIYITNIKSEIIIDDRHVKPYMYFLISCIVIVIGFLISLIK